MAYPNWLDPQDATDDLGPYPLMDEEMKEIYLCELDLLWMEDACTRKAYHSIPAWQIQLLQEALAKAKSQNKLGVHNPP